MTMSTAYLNGIADAGAGLVTHIGLVDDTGTEITGGGYARQAVTWETAVNGLIRPDADLPFSIPSGATVAGWRGYSQLAAGGTDYGGEDLTPQPFATAGTYTLLAASTSVDHNAV
ncbi:hypothetical protein E1295_31825 [Nonomuraea mesophila]|uniref:Uncharacterized protein n=1 Tax=Nonomuraea mesophila TaxID=2530382 RepID=A0A4R5F023_9ACTN|nr:hypothetical protein [Nonomuraea mesophila]TDE40490.1 hypothetical protein E1295_31825 [Nonomuraea mesophila]